MGMFSDLIDTGKKYANPVKNYRNLSTKDKYLVRGLGEYGRNIEKREKAEAEEAAAPGIEMARRNAIPLMVDEASIEAARRRAILKQAQRSGRESTMLSGGNTGGLGG